MIKNTTGSYPSDQSSKSMPSVLTVAAGRRWKLVVLAVWLFILIAIFPFASKLDTVLRDDPISYLPRNAESVEVINQLKRFPSGAVAPAAIVFTRQNGLTATDRLQIDRTRAELNRDLPVATQPLAPPVFSRDDTAALLIAPIQAADATEILVTATKDIRDRVGKGTNGLEVKVTGPAGNRTDLEAVFDSINGTLLIATVVLILVLLIAIYRSPVFWLIPFLAAIFSDLTARGLVYFTATAGMTVNDQSANILPVLVFGCGTDYALLLVARYREELRRHVDAHQAMAIALRNAGPAIVASGLTTMAALLALLLAQLNGIAGLAAVGAIGIAVAMVAMVTILPALLLIFGRRAFWPFIPRYGEEQPERMQGIWRRVGESIARRPRPVWIGTVALLAIMCLGLFDFNTRLHRANGFITEVDAVQGQELITQAFPGSTGTPVTVIVGDPTRSQAVRTALQSAPGVVSLSSEERGEPGVRFDLTLQATPFSQEAFDQISVLRSLAKQVGGSTTLIGGPTAEEYDVRVAAARDNRVIMPLVFAIVFVILAVLLQSLAAPLLIVGTIVLSFAAALGTGTFVSQRIFGFPGMDPSVALIAFVFLVAGGVDYIIFLMVRVREEAQEYGTRSGMTSGLAVTGSVITSAGIVSAGTFGALAVLPLALLIEIGFILAFGVLLDTFLVRSILVPALTYDFGSWIWWPSALAQVRSRRNF